MPISLLPRSRRSFLATVLAGSLGLRRGQGDERKSDPNRLLLFSDTHIDAKKETQRGETNMARNLESVIAKIGKLELPPSQVFVTGDLAFSDGKAGDYVTFLSLIQPLISAGIPTHLLLGNHDDRKRFRRVCVDRLPKDQPLTDHHVEVVETPFANWYLLDSLEKVNSTPGKIGSAQLAWLAKSLDDRPNKPAIILVHHNPSFNQVQSITGIKDTKEFWEVAKPRHQVKAVFFGHTHHWNIAEKDGVHSINLPPTAYVFQKGDPAGFVSALVGEKKIDLEFFALDIAHKAHGEKHSLAWR